MIIEDDGAEQEAGSCGMRSISRVRCHMDRGQLKCDGTRSETRFRLSGETDEFI